MWSEQCGGAECRVWKCTALGAWSVGVHVEGLSSDC